MRATLLALLLVPICPAARADDAPQQPAAAGTQPAAPTPVQRVAAIRQMLAQGNLEGAEQAFAEALQADPKSPQVQALHLQLYSYNLRGDKPLRGADHLAAYIDYLLGRLESPSGARVSLTFYVNGMVTAYQRAEKPEVGRAKLADVLARVEKLATDRADLQQALYQVKHVDWLTRGSDEGGAAKVNGEVAEELAAAQQALADAGEGAKQLARMRLAALLKARADLSFKLDPVGAQSAREAYLSFVSELFAAQPGDATTIGMYLDASLSAASALARSEPKQAREILEAMNKRVADLGADGKAAQEALTARARVLGGIERSIQAGMVHANLIGQPAFEFKPDAWVNGSPLTPEDLQGKVVLLDFWAVWCGPCIATFPHLREWQEQYGDKGLVIIGMTRYYSYQWDDDTKRSKRVEGLSHEDEQGEMVKFAAHHELKHRFAVMPDNEFSQKYGVTGIPQAVLIDRQGKIRMIRVGSGEQNAHDLGEMLKKLLDDTSARLEPSDAGSTAETATEAPVRAPQPALEGDLAGVTVKNQRYGMQLIRSRSKNVPKVGEPAPDFTLQTFDGKQQVTLSSLRGAKPVVLLFGSLT